MKWLKLWNPGVFESLERRAPGCIALRLNPEHRERVLEVTESEMDGLPLGVYASADGAEIVTADGQGFPVLSTFGVRLAQ